jgi:hypothetical protein
LEARGVFEDGVGDTADFGWERGEYETAQVLFSFLSGVVERRGVGALR